MILIDKLLLSPITGLIWIGQKLQEAAEEALEAEQASITGQLTELYMMLETGQISEEEFEEKEEKLLDLLEKFDTSESD